MPPTKSLRMDSPVWMPSTMDTTLGGMTAPRVVPVATTPAAKAEW